MRTPDGGSVHDPRAKLPPAMWDRGPVQTPLMCRACRGSATGRRDSPMWAIPTGPPASPDSWTTYACRVCDLADQVPA